MEYLDRLRFRLEVARITSWLQSIAPVTIKEDEADLTALECIQRRYAESCHTDKILGRPVSQQSYNHTSRDGQKIEHGATVWFVGRDGRIGRGTAYYNINSMWWVV
ncbi:MAG: hypothetical protein E5Y76_03960, partial [Mesorhizobium sp.]